MGRKLALPASSCRGFPPPYLDVPQCRPQHAQIRCLLVVHVGDVSLQGLKAFLQMGPPGERRGSSAGQPAPGGRGKGEEGEGRAQESLGGPRVGPESHTHAHTPVFLQFVVDFSGSDPVTQTDKRLREEGLIRRPSCPLPSPPKCHRFFVPDFLYKSSNGRCLPCVLVHSPPGGHKYAHNSQPL